MAGARDIVAALAMLLALATPAASQTVVPLGRIRVSATTGEKPQSKVWFHAGRWWTVLPTTSVRPEGTWLWRLGEANRWKAVLRLTPETDSQADAKPDGPLTHVLLHRGTPALVSLEYDPATQTYGFWRERPEPTSVPLDGSETATIDIDSELRMWLSTDAGTSVQVFYADYPYARFEGPITLASDIGSDDISAVAALTNRTIGVLWSNQRTRRFGFRLHVDGTDPGLWLPDEIPASQSAIEVGEGMADDHLNVAVASEGTLYAAVKTSFQTAGYPTVGLLVRRPDGRWDDLYWVDRLGTRPIVQLNEVGGALRVVYTSGDSPHNIVFNESPISPIAFGRRRVLLSGTLNDATSTKTTWSDEVVIIASGRGALVRGLGAGTTASAASMVARCTRGCVSHARACRLGARLQGVACAAACPGAARSACARACRRETSSARQACQAERRACGAGCRVPVEPAAALCRASCGGQLANCLEGTPRVARTCVSRCPRAGDRPACLASCAGAVAFAGRSCQRARAACLVPCNGLDDR